MKDSNWDIDLRDGMVGESKIADLLHLDTVEVKTDRRWVDTGNLYIETECWYVGNESWMPSGVRVSQATHWAFLLEDSVLMIPLYRLKEAVWEIGKPVTCNIPPNPSRGYLVTPGALLEYVRLARANEIAEHEEHERWEVYG